MRKPFTQEISSANEREEREKGTFIVSLIIILVTTIMLCILWTLQAPISNSIISGDIFPGGGSAENGHLPNMTKEEIQQQMQREADISKFSFKINSRPVFNSGSDAGTLRIENPNHNLYPFVVKIFLDETGEELYNSGGILPNQHISTAKLSVDLPKGHHKATAYIRAYDPETNMYAGQSAVELTLVVNN